MGSKTISLPPIVAAIFFLPIVAATPLPPIAVGMYLMLCSVTVQGSFSPVSDDGPGSQLVERLDRERGQVVLVYVLISSIKVHPAYHSLIPSLPKSRSQPLNPGVNVKP